MVKVLPQRDPKRFLRSYTKNAQLSLCFDFYTLLPSTETKY